MKNYKKIILFIVLLSIIFLTGCEFLDKYLKKDNDKNKSEINVIKVAAIKVKQTTKNINNTLIGTADPEFDIKIKAQVEGKIDQILVSEGDIVEKGQILAKIEDQEVRLRVRQAQISVKDAKSEVERSKLQKKEKILEMEKEFADVQADYLRKKILLDKRKDESETKAKLYRIKAATLEEVREAERNFEQARIDYAASAKKYQTSKELFGDEKNIRGKMLDLNIDKNENNLLSLQSELEKAEFELEKYTIKSPSNGMISDVFKTSNQYINLSDADIFSLIGVKKIHVRTNVSESDIRKIEKDSEVNITFDAIKDAQYIGRIISIKPIIDTASRSFPVRILIPNEDNNIRPGMYSRISFDKLNEVEALWIPISCMRKSGNTNYVFKINKNIAIKTSVETGRQSGDMVEIISGLKSGEQIISEGVDKVSDLSKVEILR
ncbi:MAG: hypothetical protein C0601_02050 [Candidatus Muiribacterium halophilum]|uniref:RND efflux pump membrane fusion protein barrel-sandwich domain-containing protein n=1 Tax=Muiribacterium halophilum TaxID=2053465 RepID=A0A2N5ZL92_MUIH1|nr:MAG: hypothetical protein C0601_02050 [Candidatus Muirbacterium halophilum]